MAARWQKCGNSWCMNNGDIPAILIAMEACWESRLRAIPMNNSFTWDPANIGTDAAGKHCFLADVELKSWLESSRAGIAYWHCYLLPFINKYSTNDFLRTINGPGQHQNCDLVVEKTDGTQHSC